MKADRILTSDDEPLGWIVLTWEKVRGWEPDWDGRCHKTREEADAALKEAAEGGDFGCACVLVECKYLPGTASPQLDSAWGLSQPGLHPGVVLGGDNDG